MTIKPIKTAADHAAALARLETIFDATPGTPRGDEAEVLATLVQHYEEANFPIDLPDPLAAIRFRMEQQDLKAKDLIPFIGSASKVSEVLSGRRGRSTAMIRSLVAGLGLPPAVLLQSGTPAIPRRRALKSPRHFDKIVDEPFGPRVEEFTAVSPFSSFT